MSDDFGFDEGIFADADVDVNDIPDDPFGFGNDFYSVRIVEIKKPEVTKSGDKFGMMIKYIVDDERYSTHWVGTSGLGNGHWTQLPVPKALQGSIPWDPQNNPKDKQVLTNLKNLFKALGFSADEMKHVGPAQMMHRGFLTKIKPVQTDDGFWNFRFNQMKPFPEEGSEGANEFTPEGTSNSGKSADQLAKEELEKELS